MPNSQCLSLGGKRLIKWQSSDFEVMMEDQHSEKEVDESVCELEICGGKADMQFVRWQSSDFDEEEISSNSENDDEATRQLNKLKMQLAEALKESSADKSIGERDAKAPDKGPTNDSGASLKKLVVNKSRFLM